MSPSFVGTCIRRSSLSLSSCPSWGGTLRLPHTPGRRVYASWSCSSRDAVQPSKCWGRQWKWRESRSMIFSTNMTVGIYRREWIHSCCSVYQLCWIRFDPMYCSTPGFPVLHHFPELAQTHVPCVDDAIQPSLHRLSNHLSILCCPLLLLFSIFPSIRVFLISQLFESGGQSIDTSASASMTIDQWLLRTIQDWFPLGLTGLVSLLSVQGTLKNLLQHHSSKALLLWCSAFLMVQFSCPYMTTGKTTALTIWTFVGKAMSLLLNMPSRFIISFLPRSKHLLISCPLQSLSTIILEPKKIKSVTVSIVFPFICHEATGPDPMILVFACWVLSQLFYSPLSLFS